MAQNATYRPGVVLPKPSGGDDGPTIAAAITSAVTKGLPLLAPYLGAVYLTSQTLMLPSNFEFIADLITVKARPNLNAPVFKNSDQAGGNSAIRVSGVTADYDKANQTTQANVWDIENITHSKFENVGAKNGKHVGPNLGIGVEFSLRKATYCTVRSLYAEGNQWDGMQMSGCTYNEVSDVTSVNNGRAGIQLTRWPVGSGTLKSAYNRVTGLTTRHDTGTPSALAPCTSGLYFHMSEYNVCTNINSYGTQQGVGMIEGCTGNVITTGQHQIRFDGTRGIIDIEGDCHSNLIADHVLRGLSGNTAIHVRFSGGPNTLNVVKGLRATQGAWTGQSRVIVSGTDRDNTVEMDTANGADGVSYDVQGTLNSVKFRSITTGEVIRRTSGNVDGGNTTLPLQGATPATPASEQSCSPHQPAP